MRMPGWARRWYWEHVHHPHDGIRWAIGLGWFETIEGPEWKAKRRTLCVTAWGVVVIFRLWPITAAHLERLRAERIAEQDLGDRADSFLLSDPRGPTRPATQPRPRIRLFRITKDPQAVTVWDEAKDVPDEVWDKLAGPEAKPLDEGGP